MIVPSWARTALSLTAESSSAQANPVKSRTRPGTQSRTARGHCRKAQLLRCPQRRVLVVYDLVEWRPIGRARPDDSRRDIHAVHEHRAAVVIRIRQVDLPEPDSKVLSVVSLGTGPRRPCGGTLPVSLGIQHFAVRSESLVSTPYAGRREPSHWTQTSKPRCSTDKDGAACDIGPRRGLWKRGSRPDAENKRDTRHSCQSQFLQAPTRNKSYRAQGTYCPDHVSGYRSQNTICHSPPRSLALPWGLPVNTQQVSLVPKF